MGRINSKNKGNVAERLYAKTFRNMGYSKCITSRLGSKLHDDCGIDLLHTPVLVQIKAGYEKVLNHRKELNYIEDRVNEVFADDPIMKSRIKILIHHRDMLPEDRGIGKKRKKYDSIVSMSFEDFSKLLLATFPPPKTEENDNKA